MPTTFFSSDMHFGHKNIIKYSNRPYADMAEMEEALITNHNSRVKPEDTWFHLGDFAFLGASDIRRILRRLNGKKIFIRGNHDNEANFVGLVDEFRYDWVGKIGAHRFHIYHFPIQSWEGAHHGTIHLHGHSHGSTPSVDMLRMDVGVDCHNWFPISYEEVASWADKERARLQKKDRPLDPGRRGHHDSEK